MLPILCIAQVSPKEDILSNNNPSIERGNLTTKRNAMYNLEEIKVRWKKAALENCTGVPCVVAPSFTCGTSTVSDFDGNAYNTVAIGTQCWTKENLKVTKYNDGTLIGDSTNGIWGTPGTVFFGARTIYTGPGIPSSGYVGTYGYLYNWYAATDPRKLCPTGWHVPTDAEWTTMIQQLDNMPLSNIVGVQSNTAGGKMKSTSSLWTSVNQGASNISGFSALPGGNREFTPASNIGEYAYFWSTTGDNTNIYSSLCLYLYFGANWVAKASFSKEYGLSVRCLRD